RPAAARDEGQPERPRREGIAPVRALGRGAQAAQVECALAVRRPAAAALHRPRPGHRARRRPDGRAGLCARPDRDPADRGPCGGAEERLYDCHRDPQHAAGCTDRRHDRVLQRRRVRVGRPLRHPGGARAHGAAVHPPVRRAHRGVRHGPVRVGPVASAADKGEAAAGVADLQAPRRRRATAATRRKAPPERFLNRELSWLDWNERCIELGQDATVPLLHRVRLCSFISTGLDVRSPDGRSPHATLDEIASRVRDQVRMQSDLYENALLPQLAEAEIKIGRVEQATRAELRALSAHYEREIYPVLTPLAIGPGQPFPYISGLSLSLGVFVRDPATGEERLARVKVPEGMSRFVTVGRDEVMFPLEEVIAHFLPRLFPGMEVVESAPFRVTRDADFDVSDDADDLLQAVQVELRRRRFGDVVRLEVAHAMSQRMQRRLVDSLDVSDRQVFRIRGMLDLADVSQLADIDRPELKFEAWVGVVPPAFASGDRREMFQAIAANDVLIHLPYDSFATTVEEFIKAGARDPDSVALKTTVYRTSERSPLIPALIRAAEEGKQSVCVVELKARFDESRNIHWSRALEEAGTHVAYGFPHLKVHAKTTLIVRREGRGLRRYAHIGTGNYHAVTA